MTNPHTPRDPHHHTHLRHDLPGLSHLTLCGFDLHAYLLAVRPAPPLVRSQSVGEHIGHLQKGKYILALTPDCPDCLAALRALVRPEHPAVSLPANAINTHTTLEATLTNAPELPVIPELLGDFLLYSRPLIRTLTDVINEADTPPALRERLRAALMEQSDATMTPRLARALELPSATPAAPTPPERWYALADDTNIGDPHPTARDAALAYYADELWEGRHDTMPPCMQVARAIIPTHAELAAGVAGAVIDRVTCNLDEIGGEYSEDACRAVEAGEGSLTAALTPVVAAWIARQIPTIDFWQFGPTLTFTHEDITRFAFTGESPAPAPA